MAPMPIEATEPEVERISSKVDQKPISQPRVPSPDRPDRASRNDFLIATLAAAGIATHLALRYGFKTSSLAQFVPLFLTLVLGGLPLIIRLTGKIFAREF